MAVESTMLVLDSHESFVKSAEFERAEEDVPDAVIDFFEADVLTGADAGDVDPMAIPADAAIGADVASLEAVGVLERWKFLGQGTGGWLIDGGRSFLVESFVRTDLVKL